MIVSALFDDRGVLAAIRLVTDPRPEYRNDITEADLRKRADAYVLGGVMAARFDIDAARDCTALPPAEGESAVGDAVRQAGLRASDGPGETAPRRRTSNLFPQARPERRQPATADAIDARPVRELGAAGDLSARRRAESVAHGGTVAVRHHGVAEHCAPSSLVSPAACWRSATSRRRGWRARKVAPRSSAPAQPSAGQIGAREVWHRPARAHQPRSFQHRMVEAGAAHEGAVERGAGEVGAAEHGLDQTGLAQIGVAQNRLGEVAAREARRAHQRVGEVGAGEPGAVEDRRIEHGIAQDRAGEIGAREVRLVEVRAREVGAGELCAGELRVVEIRVTQVGAGEIGAGEIVALEVDAIEFTAGQSLVLPARNSWRWSACAAVSPIAKAATSAAHSCIERVASPSSAFELIDCAAPD